MNSKISTPICDFLRGYAQSDTVRFHMPGHKGRMPGLEHYSTKVKREDPLHEENVSVIGYDHDITEIYGADSLYEASGIIAQSEKNASDLFGSGAAFYSTEGSSQCIKAMLTLACMYGRKTADRPVVLAARNVHKAFISACALADLDVRWCLPEHPEYSVCQCRISAESIRKAILSMPEKPCAVYITSPDYTGSLQDVHSIAQAAHEFDIPLLVDNAHGAYLHFLEEPVHPLDLGADMCCDSAHKTLPALTGCACLHISRNAPEKFIKYARQALSMFGSTSPSYLLLESLDRTNRVLSSESFRTQLKEAVSRTQQCCKELSEAGWQLSEPLKFFKQEPLKITVCTEGSGYTGIQLASILRRNKIECEYSDPDLLVLMPSVNTTESDFEKLVSCMRSIPVLQHGNSESDNVYTKSKLSSITYPVQAMSIREAAFSPSVTLPVEKCEGRVCADMVLSCPPAIPIAVCGEIITKEMIGMLKHYGITHTNVCQNMIHIENQWCQHPEPG